MSIGRAILRQIALPSIVLSGVFAAGFFTGTSASLSTMQTECALVQGQWKNSLCVVSEISQ